MKRIIICLSFIILIFLINKSVYAADNYYYVWENTSVDIMVGDALDNYLLLPHATLYRNDTLVDDKPGMLWGEDDTDPDYIDTSKVGTYKLTYRAVSEIEEAITVLFNVVDREAPLISLKSNIIVLSNNDPNYSRFITITDNYYSLSELSIDYNDILVNYNVPGTYKLIVNASDPSNNVSTKEFNVLVKTQDPPIYKVVDDSFKIAYGDNFIISNYFKAYDCYGVDITSKIKSSLVNTKLINGEISSNILSTQSVDFSVTDDYGNTTRWSQLFYVYDIEAPLIELYKDRIEIAIGDVDNIDKDYFIGQIKTYYDNCGVDTLDITYSNVKKAVGEYIVLYELKDKALNSIKKELVVSVICDSIPLISVSSDVRIKIGGSVNYYNYINAYDKYDGDITMNVSIDDSNVNYNEEGIYFAYASVKNSYGKYGYQTIVVRVKKGFWAKYYYLFLIPLGIGGIVAFFIIKKRKSVL